LCLDLIHHLFIVCISPDYPETFCPLYQTLSRSCSAPPILECFPEHEIILTVLLKLNIILQVSQLFKCLDLLYVQVYHLLSLNPVHVHLLNRNKTLVEIPLSFLFLKFSLLVVPVHVVVVCVDVELTPVDCYQEIILQRETE
jgi:hypothetical protein